MSEILANNAMEMGTKIKLNAKVEEIMYDGESSPVAVKL